MCLFLVGRTSSITSSGSVSSCSSSRKYCHEKTWVWLVLKSYLKPPVPLAHSNLIFLSCNTRIRSAGTAYATSTRICSIISFGCTNSVIFSNCPRDTCQVESPFYVLLRSSPGAILFPHELDNWYAKLLQDEGENTSEKCKWLIGFSCTLGSTGHDRTAKAVSHAWWTPWRHKELIRLKCSFLKQLATRRRSKREGRLAHRVAKAIIV